MTHVSHMEHKKFEKVGFGAIGITASEIVQDRSTQRMQARTLTKWHSIKVMDHYEDTEHMRTNPGLPDLRLVLKAHCI